MTEAIQRTEKENEYLLHEKEFWLGDSYLPSPFSSQDFRFCLEKSDWEAIKRHISSIMLYITNDCNSSCSICYRKSKIGDGSKEMSKEKIDEVLDKIGKNKRVTLIGGEPTVREDIFEIIKMVKKKGHSPEIFTNGLKLSDIKYVKKLKEAGVNRVYLSFDGFREEIYEKMRGDGSQIKAKLLALRNLEAFEINTVVSSVIAKDINEDQIEPLIEFCLDSIREGTSHIDGLLFYGLTNTGRCNLEGHQISAKELLKLMQKETEGQVTSDYLMETKKLALNISRIMNKLNLPLNFGTGGFIGIYEPGSIKPFVPFQKIKKLNKLIEGGKKLGFGLEVLKTKKLRRMLWKFLSGSGVIKSITAPGAIFLGAGGITSPSSHKPRMTGTVGLGQGPGNKIMVNSSGHDGSSEHT